MGLTKTNTVEPQHGTATSCQSCLSGAVPGSTIQARLFLLRFFLLRALPAWKRNGSVDAALAAKFPSALPKASDEMRILVEPKALEAEARGCATLRVNGTGSRAVPWFEDAHHLRKCASWKIPIIPSKMRTLFQDAHAKLSIFAERCGARAPGPRVPHCGC